MTRIIKVITSANARYQYRAAIDLDDPDQDCGCPVQAEKTNSRATEQRYKSRQTHATKRSRQTSDELTVGNETKFVDQKIYSLVKRVMASPLVVRGQDPPERYLCGE